MKPEYTFTPITSGKLVRGKEPMRVEFPNGVIQEVHAWDYATLFQHPFLYEQYYSYLMLDSHRIMWSLFLDVLQMQKIPNSLKILDMAAGSGLMGVEAKKSGLCSLIVGMDILPEARFAADRDHPGVYDKYYVADLLHMPSEDLKWLKSREFDAIFVVSATGGGDEGDMYHTKGDVWLDYYKILYSFLRKGGHLVLNVRETPVPDQIAVLEFLRDRCTVKASKLHFHRYLIDGTPCNYKTFVMCKNNEDSSSISV